MTTGRPVLELLVAPGTAEAAAPLVRRLTRWCLPRTFDPRLAPPVAVLVTSPRAPGLAEALGRPDTPVAVCARRGDDLGALGGATVVVTDDEAVADEVGERAVLLPPSGVDARTLPWLAPFVRRRHRLRAGLDADLVVSVGVPGAPVLPEDLWVTALALAAAAVVTGPLLTTALALGTPVATDLLSAERLGPEDGHLAAVAVAASAADAQREATALAGEPDRAAALSLGGRRLVERRFDLGPPTTDLARRLGLVPAGSGPHRLVADRLTELSTPSGSRVIDRGAAALSGFRSPMEG